MGALNATIENEIPDGITRADVAVDVRVSLERPEDKENKARTDLAQKVRETAERQLVKWYTGQLGTASCTLKVYVVLAREGSMLNALPRKGRGRHRGVPRVVPADERRLENVHGRPGRGQGAPALHEPRAGAHRSLPPAARPGNCGEDQHPEPVGRDEAPALIMCFQAKREKEIRFPHVLLPAPIAASFIGTVRRRSSRFHLPKMFA
jgi:hypothetical protein